MKKLPLSALIVSVALLSACEQEPEAVTNDNVVGGAAQVAELTQQYHQQMEAMAKSAPATANTAAQQAHVIGGAAAVAKVTEQYHQQMKAMAKTNSAVTAIEIGSAEAVAEVTRQYHKKMEAMSK